MVHLSNHSSIYFNFNSSAKAQGGSLEVVNYAHMLHNCSPLHSSKDCGYAKSMHAVCDGTCMKLTTRKCFEIHVT